MRHFLTYALALLAAAPAFAADPEIAFEKYQLPNGLTVIMSEDHRLPQVAVNVWYHVGAANQSPGRSGFAHLFEHMMFSGSKHVQPSPFKVLEGIGTLGGAMANGTTNFDRTNYYEVVASSELATGLWLESDRMAFLLDTIDAKKLAIQRDVVSNERRQSYENRAYGLAQLRTCDTFYPSPHPYYQCVIGSIAEIQAASVDDLKLFFKQYYGPNNASLAIVGDFKIAEAKALVEKYFGPIPAGPKVTPPTAQMNMLNSVVRETVQDKVAEVPRLTINWSTGIKLYDADEAAGDVLGAVLGTGRSSRLYRSLVVEKQVASDVSADNMATGLGGLFEVEVTAANGKTVADIVAPVQAVIDDLKKNGPTAAEVERVKRKLVAGQLRAIERLAGKADMLNSYQTFVGDPGYLPKDLARYRAVTPEMVKAFANKYLHDDKRLELTTVPMPKTASSK